ncbi:MAG: HlyD family efflux transporter periplasmic adaptor subunit [Synergistaceae bacterium]|nr:HlyD family efflux transporter periplasmic adaptor subunit [Synergistaceae bacterium]
MKINKKMIPVIIVALAALFAIYTIFLKSDGEDPNRIFASGTIETTDADMSFMANGFLKNRKVNEGDTVHRGDLIAELDKREAEARLRQSAAAVETARSRLKDLSSGYRSQEIAEAEAQTAQFRSSWNNLKDEAERSEKLFSGGAISRQRLDRDITAAEVAGSQLTAAKKKVELLRSGFRENSIDASANQLKEAEASMEAAKVIVSNHVLISPMDGVVSKVYSEPGEMIVMGKPVLTLTSLNRPRVKVYIPEYRIGRIMLGQKADITVDSFPDKKYPATVTFISPEAEFTPKTVQTAEERVKLVFAVEVTAETTEGHLKPGMPADVTIDLSDE